MQFLIMKAWDAVVAKFSLNYKKKFNPKDGFKCNIDPTKYIKYLYVLWENAKYYLKTKVL